jgi:uncharacterized integral membrane protein
VTKAFPYGPRQNPEPSDSTPTAIGRPVDPNTASGQHQPEKIPPGTRIGAIWIGIILFCLVLLLLIIFILQNRQSVQISYFALRGHLPLTVATLLSAVGAVLLAAIAGSLRIWQLRRNIRGDTSGHGGSVRRRVRRS